MNQIPSLKILAYNLRLNCSTTIQNIPFASFPGAEDRLKNLLELRWCYSGDPPKHYHKCFVTSIKLNNDGKQWKNPY